jgi:hypothetical protein
VPARVTPLLTAPLYSAGSKTCTEPQPIPTFGSAWLRIRPSAGRSTSAPRSWSVRQSPRPMYSTQPLGATVIPCDSPLVASPVSIGPPPTTRVPR